MTSETSPSKNRRRTRSHAGIVTRPPRPRVPDKGIQPRPRARRVAIARDNPCERVPLPQFQQQDVAFFGCQWRARGLTRGRLARQPACRLRISYAGTLARLRSVTAPEAALGRDGVGSLISHRSRLESTHRLSPIYLRCRYDQYSTVAPPGEPRAVRAAHSIADTVAASARTSASRSQRGCFALRKVGQAKLPARPLGRAHPTWPSLASAPRHARSHIARLCGWLLTLSRRAS